MLNERRRRAEGLGKMKEMGGVRGMLGLRGIRGVAILKRMGEVGWGQDSRMATAAAWVGEWVRLRWMVRAPRAARRRAPVSCRRIAG